jgi:hypothetical protein
MREVSDDDDEYGDDHTRHIDESGDSGGRQVGRSGQRGYGADRFSA